MKRRPVLWLGIGAIVLLIGAVSSLVRHPGIAPVETPTRASFPLETIRRGETLAAAGFCETCHTAADGPALAGGRPLATPFGTVYGTNITPDRETGIGAWSLAAFRRAMREGVDRRGRQLYPAFPYTHFTALTDGDLEGLYAYLMTREPVRAENLRPALAFPFNLRPLVAFWNLLFLRQGPLTEDPARDKLWNRGAYLAEALSHCGACHTPRNLLGAERSQARYAGGEAEGWWSPPLDASSPSRLPWTQESLFNYLRSWDAVHGGAAGPMEPVVRGLARLPPEDVRAIAAYVGAWMGPRETAAEMPPEAMLPPKEPPGAEPAVRRGSLIYAGACAGCHESGGSGPFTVGSLAQHTSLWGPDPSNVIRVLVHGIRPQEGEVGAIMPAFGAALPQAQMVDLLAYLRARFTDQPAWPRAEAELRKVIAEESPR